MRQRYSCMVVKALVEEMPVDIWHLNLQGAIQYTIGNSEEINKFNFGQPNKEKGGNAEGYGAIAGQLTTSAKESTLLIQNFKVTSKFTSV